MLQCSIEIPATFLPVSILPPYRTSLLQADRTSEHAKPKPDDPMRSPLLFTTGHENLPPAYFLIGGADPWRDSGLIYEEVLREECGVKTKVDIFPGLPHGFWAAFPAAGFSKEFRGKSDEGLAWLFHQCDYRQN
jgi:acetyl esterase/lipase